MENKYNAKKTEIDGKVFDSRKEARRFEQLKAQLRAGVISGLRTQVVYELIPAQYGEAVTGARGGIKQGKLLERAVTYRADFVYTNNYTGEVVVEDVKGGATKTPEYIIKRKLMLWKYNIKIREV